MAMTREQICVEQSNFNSQSTAQTGVNVWLPLGTAVDEWILHIMQTHNTANGNVDCWNHGESYAVKCVPGSYIPARGDSPELSFPGGNYNNDQFFTITPNKWQVLRNIAITGRNIRLTVPANTTRLYIIGAGGGSYGNMDVSLISGSATIVQSQWNLLLGGDFELGASGAPIYSSGSMKLLARDCGGAVLNFIGNSGDAIAVGGFIAINDNGAAAEFNPFDGVFDPETIVEVMVRSFSNNYQEADGPLYLDVSGANGKFWGLGHWDADDTLINAAQTIYYQDSGTDAWVDWTTVDTVNTHVRKKAWAFGRTLKGNMQYDAGGTDYTIGTYTSIYSYNTSGLSITLDHLFNATAEAQSIGFGARGGYGGIWSITRGFARYMKSFPVLDIGNKYTINTIPFVNNNVVFTQQGSFLQFYGGASGYEAHIQGEGVLLSGGGTILKSSPLIFGIERVASDDKMLKVFFNMKYDTTTLSITDGDRAFSKHTRMITKSNELGTKIKRRPRI